MTNSLEALIARKGNAVTGNYYLAECGSCGEMFTSERMTGGQAIADTGDYGDCYCPHCETPDSEITDCGAINSVAVEAWNYQQKHIDALIAALEQSEQRIEEFENDEVHQRLANADHQLHMSELAKQNLRASRKAQFRKRRVSEQRIAELEAAAVKPVKLPMGYTIRSGHPINESGRDVMIPKDGGDWLHRFDLEHAIKVAGFKVEEE